MCRIQKLYTRFILKRPLLFAVVKGITIFYDPDDFNSIQHLQCCVRRGSNHITLFSFTYQELLFHKMHQHNLSKAAL
uniref:Putative secreted protein n=1 Tax=Rhipicephalus microplus TaxID=6941 RepID=A0A6G5A3C8_RHIMP